MRTMLVVVALLATGCAKSGCSACEDPNLEAQCRDQVKTCTLLGPAAILLGGNCKEQAYAICDVLDSGDTTDTDGL